MYSALGLAKSGADISSVKVFIYQLMHNRVAVKEY